MKAFTRFISTGLTLLVLAHCGNASRPTTPVPPGPPQDDLTVTLRQHANPEQLLGDYKKKVQERLEDIYQVDNYVYCWDGAEGIPSIDGDNGITEMSDGSGSIPKHTDTNLQEAGVDEADIIKTDGTHIYVATQKGVDIFKAWPLSAFNRIGQITLAEAEEDSSDREIYLYNSYLVVSSKNSFNWCMGCDFVLGGGDQPSNKLDIFDITSPSDPKKVLSRVLLGQPVASRLVNGRLHMALTGSLEPDLYPEGGIQVDYNLYDEACSDDATTKAAARSEISTILSHAKKEVEERISSLSADDMLALVATEDGKKVSGLENLYYSNDDENATSTVGLYSLDLEDGREKTTVIRGEAYIVYASVDSFYLASTHWASAKTGLHRFALGHGSKQTPHQYVTSGSVVGTIHNQFHMSEHEGIFRIATTEGMLSRGGSDIHNNVFLLDASKDGLPEIGSLKGLAKGEDIYAVRFIGLKGYVVTFKKVDPLFVLDLSDPAKPAVQGELKVPGYSTYLHPLNSETLIGLGKDADDVGEFAWFQGLKLSVFDVTDGTNPSLTDDEIIGSRGSESVALSNHHAFTYDSSTSLLALPLSLATGSQGGSEYGSHAYSGIHLYKVTPQGIDLHAVVKSEMEPLRSLFIGEEGEQVMYFLDHGQLHAVDMDQPDRIQKSLDHEGINGWGYELF